MDKTGYTKGPWTAGQAVLRLNRYLEADIHVGAPENIGNIIATVFMGGGGATLNNKPAVEANAHLIAAAPEMFEALRDLSIFYGDDTEAREVLRSDFTGPEPLLMDDDALRESVWINARAALSKALGEGQEDNG